MFRFILGIPSKIDLKSNDVADALFCVLGANASVVQLNLQKGNEFGYSLQHLSSLTSTISLIN